MKEDEVEAVKYAISILGFKCLTFYRLKNNPGIIFQLGKNAQILFTYKPMLRMFPGFDVIYEDKVYMIRLKFFWAIGFAIDVVKEPFIKAIYLETFVKLSFVGCLLYYFL